MSSVFLKNAAAVLEGGQHFYIPYLHGRHSRGIRRKNDEIRMLARGKASLLVFLKILVRRMDSDGAQRIQYADALLRAKGHALLCDAVHRAPDSLQHVGFYHRCVLMERIRDAQRPGRCSRADIGRPLRAEVFHVHITPVIHMRHKKRRDHAYLFHTRQLILPYKLGMYHHRADIRRIIKLAKGFIEHADILFSRGIAVAVRQKLPALAQGAASARQKLFV